jgi:hypothetical protein
MSAPTGLAGCLIYGIPNMKLDKDIVQRRVDLLAAEGIVCHLHTEIGKDIPAERAAQEFDALVLCRRRHHPARPARRWPRVEGHPFCHGVLAYTTSAAGFRAERSEHKLGKITVTFRRAAKM